MRIYVVNEPTFIYPFGDGKRKEIEKGNEIDNKTEVETTFIFPFGDRKEKGSEQRQRYEDSSRANLCIFPFNDRRKEIEKENEIDKK